MAKKQQEVIVVGSKTRDVVKGSGMNMSGDFAQALSDKTRELIGNATRRAKDNGRKTVRASDL
jgi:histone H3/H4